MDKLIYSIKSGAPCILGYEGEHRKTEIEFSGYIKRDPFNALYFNLQDASGAEEVLLVGYSFDVAQPLTNRHGTFAGQLIERDNEGHFVSKSERFDVVILRANEDGEDVAEQDATVPHVSAALNEALQDARKLEADLIAKRDAGEFNGKDGADGKDGKDGSNYEITSADYEAIAEKVKPYDDTEIREELAEKVGFTDYATSSKGGVIKSNANFIVQSNGTPYTPSYAYPTYKSMSNNNFVGKGTLENVLAERLKEPQFELIEEIVLAEDVANIEIDASGYKTLKMFLTFPAYTSSVNCNIGLTNGGFEYCRQTLVTTSQAYRIVEIEATNIGTNVRYTPSTNGIYYNNKAWNASATYYGINREIKALGKMYITSGGVACFKSGGKIEVYGIRA